MPPLSEIATNPDVVSLIVEQLGVADGLRLAGVSKVWRDSSRIVWGHAKSLSSTGKSFVSSEKRLHADSLLRNLHQKIGSKQAKDAVLDQPARVILLPNGDVCVVDSSPFAEMRRVVVFSAELEIKRTLTCSTPLVYPSHEARGSSCEGTFTAVAATTTHLYVTWYCSGLYSNGAALYKYRLSDFELVETREAMHKVSDDWDGTEDEHLDWDTYFHMPCDLAVHGERLFVCDAGGESGESGIVMFDLNMKHLATIGDRNEMVHPEGIAVRDGLIYVASTNAEPQFAIALYDAEFDVEEYGTDYNFAMRDDAKNRYMRCEGSPISIAFARGRMLVGCASKDVKCFTPDGVLMQTLKLGYMPTSLCAHDAKNRVYAADQCGADVKILAFKGEPPPSDAAVAGSIAWAARGKRASLEDLRTLLVELESRTEPPTPEIADTIDMLSIPFRDPGRIQGGGSLPGGMNTTSAGQLVRTIFFGIMRNPPPLEAAALRDEGIAAALEVFHDLLDKSKAPADNETAEAIHEEIVATLTGVLAKLDPADEETVADVTGTLANIQADWASRVAKQRTKEMRGVRAALQGLRDLFSKLQGCTSPEEPRAQALRAEAVSELTSLIAELDPSGEAPYVADLKEMLAEMEADDWFERATAVVGAGSTTTAD